MKFTEALENYIDLKCECETSPDPDLSQKDLDEQRKSLQAELDEAVRVLDSFVLPINI